MFSSGFKLVVGATAILLVGAAIETSAASAPPLSAAHAIQADSSVMDSVYSLEQAGRGAEKFEGVCTRCHTTEHFTPGGLHAITTRYANLGQMFEAISTRMPADDPGSLSAQDYADVMSYILALNRYPAGAVELPNDVSVLTPILIVPLPTAAAN